MARRPPIRISADDFPDDERGRPGFVVEPIDPAEIAYNEILQENGPGEIQIKIYKIEDGEERYCHTFNNAQQANEEGVRRLGYGDGRYVRKLVVGGVFRTSLPMALASKVNAQAETNGHDSQVVQLLREQNTMLQNTLRDLMTRGGGGGFEKEPMSALLTAFSQMQNMNRPAELPVDTLLKAIEIGKSVASAGGGEDGESLIGMVKEVLKAAAPALSSILMSRGPGPAPGATVDPPMRTVNPPAELPPQQTEAQMEAIQKAQMKVGIEYLKRKCLAGADPRLYIAWIVDNYEDDAACQLLVSASLEKEFSVFVSLDPSIGNEPFEKFFRAIYDGLRSSFAEPHTVANDIGGENGNKPNTPGDAAPSKRGGKKSGVR